MGNNFEPARIVSPKAARVLWLIAMAVAGLSLALNLWGWARRGWGWTTVLGSLGMLLLIASYSVMRSRRRLYALLQAAGLVLITAHLILTPRRW